jgi:hypothetical protein
VKLWRDQCKSAGISPCGPRKILGYSMSDSEATSLFIDWLVKQILSNDIPTGYLDLIKIGYQNMKLNYQIDIIIK